VPNTGENTSNQSITHNPTTPISRSELDLTIYRKIQNTGKFKQSNVSNELDWSASTQSNRVLLVEHKSKNGAELISFLKFMVQPSQLKLRPAKRQ